MMKSDEDFKHFQHLSVHLREFDNDQVKLEVRDLHDSPNYEQQPVFDIAFKLKQHVPVQHNVEEAAALHINPAGEFASVLNFAVKKRLSDQKMIAVILLDNLLSEKKRAVLATVFAYGDEKGRLVSEVT
jgi:hypothetical protein